MGVPQARSSFAPAAELDAVIEATLGVIGVRNVRDAVGVGTCAACAGCGTMRSSSLARVDADCNGL